VVRAATLRTLVFVLISVAAAGCRCDEHKPYTPFGVTSALPGSNTAAPSNGAPSAATPSDADAGFAVARSVLAPRGATRFDLGGRSLDAPAGFIFDQALDGAFEADGRRGAVAWMLPAAPASDGTPAIPELYYFPEQGDARRVYTLPGFVPTSPNCKLETTLVQSGPKSVTLDAAATCEGNLIQRSPSRALSVLAPSAERPEILTLRVAAPAPGEALALRTDTSDRDGDGRDDVRVLVSLAANGAKPVEAELAFLDRAAGVSRDPSEPSKSLSRLAGGQVQRAKNKKTAADALQRVALIRRLMGSLCAEGGTARLFDRDGAGISCGALGGVVDSLASAEVAAELSLGNALGAFGAIARDGWYFGKTSAATRKKLEASALDAVELVTTRAVFLEQRPRLPPAPRFSPLAFDASGRLFLETDQGRFDLGSDGSAPARVEGDAGAARSLEVVSATGERLVAVAYSCDRSETTLIRASAAGPLPPLSIPLLAPRPGACGRGRFEALPVPSPLGFSDRPDLVVGGVITGGALEGLSGVPGGARSENGRFLAVPSVRGVLVVGTTTRLFDLGAQVAEPLRLTDCVPSGDGTRVACVLGDRALLAIAGGT
jgi:hypothetical protein